MRYGFDPARPSVSAQSYAGADSAAPSRPRVRRRRANPLLTAACLLLAAALCVALLLCRARVTALADECDTLAGRITELADENAHLTIEYESMYSLTEIESYARSCWAAAMSSERSASLDAAASISAMASPLIVW